VRLGRKFVLSHDGDSVEVAAYLGGHNLSELQEGDGGSVWLIVCNRRRLRKSPERVAVASFDPERARLLAGAIRRAADQIDSRRASGATR
jgi:hypothetical protein